MTFFSYLTLSWLKHSQSILLNARPLMTMPIFPLPLGETGMLEELEHRNVLPLPPTGVRLSPGVQAFVMKRFWECSLMMTYLFPSTYQRHKGLPNSLKWESVGFLKPIIVYSPLWLSSPGIFHSHVSSYSAPSNSQHCHHSILIWRGCSCVLLGKTVSPDFRVAVCPAASPSPGSKEGHCSSLSSFSLLLGWKWLLYTLELKSIAHSFYH